MKHQDYNHDDRGRCEQNGVRAHVNYSGKLDTFGRAGEGYELRLHFGHWYLQPSYHIDHGLIQRRPILILPSSAAATHEIRLPGVTARLLTQA